MRQVEIDAEQLEELRGVVTDAQTAIVCAIQKNADRQVELLMRVAALLEQAR